MSAVTVLQGILIVLYFFAGITFLRMDTCVLNNLYHGAVYNTPKEKIIAGLWSIMAGVYSLFFILLGCNAIKFVVGSILFAVIMK